ncbi:MAG: hypothetical protein CO002_00170 [Candidatus Portnoybacteria bacterium CG_4_8_14_3_um_filter_44_10]|uniref:Uncharacterized protein n=5 Tax=Candidatus Portnoyibacteriota TaxID=1817913 RepID=A0A2H0KQH1_9BACT|nr:MAG: hypothetical protein COV85_02405 [Candidatus Portnoybacteria bacterium CG11_big_fil_rev_8_21_14_0_20_44_10]PIS16138.1 MAG: hypothetical protein COT61_05525 [Candidatus Portnoybacteria bacterium CG09_land_8_20_14_0_10_44_13]PIW75782.1 MAG: hypothetical protein CO002_00170 [Candidatus Portnoybacteria bacterium CG_4_8_14_3_um_filter_44_10]PIZ69937.1 MAG: hypothetical protein COY11_03645 [Candidatus Portnoybacteria bacterium CG_4_10_14_0_2_um_filter_44_20]PJA63473.1 MAG: hypothetical protei
MSNDYKELIEYLGEWFSKIDSRLERLEENKADKLDVRELSATVESYVQRADTYFQEMVVLAHKVDRHEKWFHQIAEKVGVKLEY